MKSRLEVRTESLGGGSLARRAMEGGAPEWYVRAPANGAEWAARGAAVRAESPGAWLDALRPAFGSSVADSAAGARLARSAASPHGVVVTTGQQPGLFGGPLYTWTKALSALALADALEAETGYPVAPVFWAATDDADFAEASSTMVSVPGGAEQIRISRDVPEGLPMSAVPLGDDVRDACAKLARAAGSAAYADVLDLARDAYAPGVTVGDAYVRVLRAILEPLGVAVLDASNASTRDAADRTVRAALSRAADVERALEERARAIAAAGYAVQVAPVPRLTLVFTNDERGKRRVRRDEADELATRAPRGSLGPNVLLRPIVERAVLPSVAYVGGPGEIAYYAQVSAVADVLGSPAPLVVPRWSCTIIEPHIGRILTRLGLTAGDLAEPNAAESRLARTTLPESLVAALADFRDAITRGSAKLRASQDGSAPPALPSTVIDGAERALLHRLDRVERRAVALEKRRQSATMRDVATARGALFPNGMRQERALNALPLLARHGPELLDALRAGASSHAARLVGAPRDGSTLSSAQSGGVVTG